MRLDGLVWSAFGTDTPHSTVQCGEDEHTRDLKKNTYKKRNEDLIQNSNNRVGNDMDIGSVLHYEMLINERDKREMRVQSYVCSAFEIIQKEKNVRILRNRIQHFHENKLYEKNLKESRENEERIDRERQRERQRERRRERERGRVRDRERDREREREESGLSSADSLVSQTDDTHTSSFSSSFSSSSSSSSFRSNAMYSHENENEIDNENYDEYGSENENSENDSVDNSTTVKNTDFDFRDRIPYNPSTIIVRPHALEHILETLHRW